MEKAKNPLFLPLRMAGAIVRIGGRITIGSVGFVMMAAGLLLTFDLPYPYIGVPLLLIGSLLLVKAIF